MHSRQFDDAMKRAVSELPKIPNTRPRREESEEMHHRLLDNAEDGLRRAIADLPRTLIPKPRTYKPDSEYRQFVVGELSATICQFFGAVNMVGSSSPRINGITDMVKDAIDLFIATSTHLQEIERFSSVIDRWVTVATNKPNVAFSFIVDIIHHHLEKLSWAYKRKLEAAHLWNSIETVTNNIIVDFEVSTHQFEKRISRQVSSLLEVISYGALADVELSPQEIGSITSLQRAFHLLSSDGNLRVSAVLSRFVAGSAEKPKRLLRVVEMIRRFLAGGDGTENSTTTPHTTIPSHTTLPSISKTFPPGCSPMYPIQLVPHQADHHTFLDRKN